MKNNMDTLLESLLDNKIFEDEFDDVFQPMPMEEFIKNLTSQKGWTQNKDGSWDVDGNIYLNDMNLIKLPLKFGKVSGIFTCSNNQLISLEGAPKEVGEGFYCSRNKLTNLIGGPEYVGGSFWAIENNLTTLQGGPKEVGGEWFLTGNSVSVKELLKTLEK